MPQNLGAEGHSARVSEPSSRPAEKIGRQGQTWRTQDKWHTEFDVSSISGIRSGVQVFMPNVCVIGARVSLSFVWAIWGFRMIAMFGRLRLENF